MNFLCRLGWHRPAPTPRWHAGLYFTKCLRCGSDLVRLPRGRWAVPSDVLVLWRERAAASVSAPEGGAHPSGVAPVEPAADALAAAGTAKGEETAARPAPLPDFMDEGVAPDEALSPNRPGRGGATSRPREQRRPAERPSLLWLAAALAGAGLLAGAAIAALSVATFVVRTATPAAPAAVTAPSVVAPPGPVAAPPPPRHAESMIVTADYRGCTRRDRRRLRRRGRAAAEEQVRILEADGHWVTLTRASTSCWTLRTGHLPPTGIP